MTGLVDLIANPHQNHPGIAWLAGRRRFLAQIAGRAPPLFFDHLEDRPGTWTTVANDERGSRRCELGTPSGTNGPLAGSGASDHEWTTNSGDDGPDSDLALRSPAAELKDPLDAGLPFHAFRDDDGVGDTVTARFPTASDEGALRKPASLEMEELEEN